MPPSLSLSLTLTFSLIITSFSRTLIKSQSSHSPTPFSQIQYRPNSSSSSSSCLHFFRSLLLPDRAMDGYGSGYRCSGEADGRRIEIVSGRNGFGSSSSQIYSVGAHPSPDPGPYPGRSGTQGSAAAAATVAATPWSFGDPEMKRRKRIAKYKVYAVEGKIKASLKRGFRWVKDKCSEIVHGF